MSRNSIVPRNTPCGHHTPGMTLENQAEARMRLSGMCLSPCSTLRVKALNFMGFVPSFLFAYSQHLPSQLIFDAKKVE